MSGNDTRMMVGETEQAGTTIEGGGLPTAVFLPTGTFVDRYVVLGSLGTGGMGVVHSAYDPELDRKVALKLVRLDEEGANSSAGRARLLREAQALARLSHPNVLTVFDVGTFQDQVFLATELVVGSNLREWLVQRPRSLQEVLRVFIQAGQGLRAAHAAGLVHGRGGRETGSPRPAR